jgi:RNA polymerase sigma-70 factor (ECF subfamily)
MGDQGGYIQFLAEARSGGQAALGRLAVLVRKRLYPFIFRRTLNRDATEDVLQETLLTMLGRLDSLRDGQRFWPWIYRIAWSKVQDRLRDRQLRSRCETALLRCRSAAERAGDDGPLALQVRQETLGQVVVALERLDHRQRDILRLRCCDDLSYTQIAARMNTTPNQARVRFHRAKKSLKARLVWCA